ncbi:hypothetical protein [Saccharopolyspora cebuensis]|uniref:Uncharacterized protein n=1 Tax=Saccharopolyspora cebuensis TaxID=418759 RepID=A0ABV4CFM0_9PSEU
MQENPKEHAENISRLEERSGTAARLFDVRAVISGLFLVYGVLIGGAGLFPTEAGMAKSQGININLWTGLAMLVVGAAFALWLKLRPLGHGDR